MSRGAYSGWHEGSPLHGLLTAFTGGRPLPFNEEAEQALLGAMLANHHAIEKVRDWLAPDDFHVEIHKRIYGACVEMLAAGRIPDPISLRRLFEQADDLTDVGGVGYLAALAGSIVSVISAEEYARVILDCSRKRKMIEAAVEVAQAAMDPSDATPVDALVQQAEGKFSGLGGTADARKGPRHVSAVVDEMHDHWSQMKAGKLNTLPTGLVDFDRQLGALMPGDVCVIAARPGQGKSTLARTVIANVAALGKPCLFFSQEMTAVQAAMGLVQQRSGLEATKLRQASLTTEEMAAAMRYSFEIKSLPIWIDDSSALTIERMRSRIRQVKREVGDLPLVCIDYLQLMSADGRGRSLAEEVEYLTKNIKNTAKDEGLVVLELSQLSRAVESRDNKRPGLSDLRNSGSIEQDADIVTFIYREEMYLRKEMPSGRAAHDDGSFARWEQRMEEARGVSELIVEKNRNGEPGIVRAHFDGVRSLFTNAAPSYLNGRGATKANGQWHDEDWRE